MKAEVYSWRISSDLKLGLEREARRRNLSVSAALDLAAREWLHKSGAQNGCKEEQLRLHKAAADCLGAFAGGKTRRSENARETLRKRLRRRYDR